MNEPEFDARAAIAPLSELAHTLEREQIFVRAAIRALMNIAPGGRQAVRIAVETYIANLLASEGDDLLPIQGEVFLRRLGLEPR